MRSIKGLALVVAVLLLSAPAAAEPIGDAERFLCAVVVQEMCTSYGPCTEGGPLWDTGVPEFVEIDTKKKTINTTKASQKKRSTKLDMEREGELIVMQVFEGGKAFSMIVNASTGVGTASITSDEEVITLFTTCTPM